MLTVQQKEDMCENLGYDKEKSPHLVELKIQLPQDLYVAYQRCSWAIIHEDGRTPIEVMEEMVRDFLIKHGC